MDTPESSAGIDRSAVSADLEKDILRHIVTTLGSDDQRITPNRVFKALCLAVRDRMAVNWVHTRREYYAEKAKRVYYLSMEFLPGRFLRQNILRLGLAREVDAVLSGWGMSLDDLEQREAEPGLGNGGLGRLASCCLDSMAALRIPGHGYGIRYDYGLFEQAIENGCQVERADNWLRFGSVWQFDRPHFFYLVRFYGRVECYLDERAGCAGGGRTPPRSGPWPATFDPRPGQFLHHEHAAVGGQGDLGFNLCFFNSGDYVGALREKIQSEDISMVLYPEDDTLQGRELRFRQQYFLVSATLQDIMRRHGKDGGTLDNLPAEVAIHLNETHPAIAVAELMRILVDEEFMDWDAAWDICKGVFTYTNHTVLPEALECWPVDLVGHVLPRHMEIIYEINRRFLDEVAAKYPGDLGRLERLSIIGEGPVKHVRMAHLAVVASHKVNGVARLHTEILKERVFGDLYRMYPERFVNVTNGISPRRFLTQANPGLAGLITEAIGPAWKKDLTRLRDLAGLAGDAAFCARWTAVRHANKKALCGFVKNTVGVDVAPEALFDAQVKRIHEYKRQVLNVLHVIPCTNRIKVIGEQPAVPRVVLFGGKAAPGYSMAKRIIALIGAVATTVNADPEARDSLKVVFLPNFSVSASERLIRPRTSRSRSPRPAWRPRARAT
jgi:starch phosphorylase